jgi:hypothetical protein
MAKLSQIRSDLELESKGVWVTYSLDIEYLIGRQSTPAYKSYLRALSKPFRNRLQGSDPDETLLIGLINKALARHVFLGWRNLEQEDGKPLVYSEKEALKILEAPEYHNTREFVLDVSNREDLFRAAITAEIEKN